MADLVDSMLDLMRRLPPTRTEENVAALINICPDYADDLLGSVDQPLQLKTDRATGRDYLACDYNRDGESYRYASTSSAHGGEPTVSSDHHGQTSMTRLSTTALCPRPSFGNLRLRRTKRLTLIEKCT